jgi:hypothetical protein
VSRLSKGAEWFYHFLGSKKLAASLLLLLCVILIPRTFTETTDISLSTVPSVILGLMGLNLMLCTAQRLKTLSHPVLIMHIGAILVLGGAVISSFGFVATVNVYEGTSVESVYRWDLKKEMPLEVNLRVNKIHMEYYPMPVKVGVLRGEDKAGLFQLKTGNSFQLDKYTVRADSMEFPSENLRLTIKEGDQVLGTAETNGERSLPEDFPYDFKLVAYKDPSLKRAWVDLTLSKDSQVIAEGSSEVNDPLTWGKTSFHMVKVDADKFGLRFVGIQITNDPGKPYVYMGFAVLGLGSALYLRKKIAGKAR